MSAWQEQPRILVREASGVVYSEQKYGGGRSWWRERNGREDRYLRLAGGVCDTGSATCVSRDLNQPTTFH